MENLDGMSADDLWTFGNRLRKATRNYMAKIVGDKRKGYTEIARLIAGYAENKAVAMKCRARGDIVAAAIYEKICDGLYQRLPEDQRW